MKSLYARRIITTTFVFQEAAEVFRRSDCGQEPVIKAVLVPS
jgi:hypothetical protein